jgi:hypothetical protein
MKTLMLILCTLTFTFLYSQEINWGKEQNGLQLGIAYEKDSLEIHIKNVTKSPINFCRHINSKELEFYRLEFSNSQNKVYNIYVGNELAKGTQPHVLILMPEETLVQKVFIEEWKDKNGNISVPKGNYKLFVYYENSRCHKLSPDHWNGTLSAGFIAYQVK